MKLTSLFIMPLALAVCFGCTNKQTAGSDFSQADSVFVYDFYKSINGISIEDVEDLIKNDLQQLDSTYFVEYESPINGYSVKVVLKDFERLANIAYIGSAIMLLTDSCTTRILIHPDFSLPDSIAEQLKIKTINRISYDIISNNYYSRNQLGQFSNIPFAFFDVNFDGEMELLLRHPHLGQRGSSAYSPYIESSTNRNGYEEHNIIKATVSANVPKLDDMTEFDKENREVIEFSPTDQDGNLKLYYKFSNNEVYLSKIEIFDKTWKQLKKSYIYE